ncbi:polynucleotide 5'-hydroxyl-kinase NOL9 isoform X2 [Ooceraea biroi]|uniref:polynucleotide 5'-hydroxyl-kinase NOL9 isoform X2 n=1 Tax=Ooceraea biroi TaxID=2015173 RepID=UPI0005BDDD01|nr:polynucleotide 5'-hydroxyl-kinase NOL9 isoform X2 [Ooceraea biroi]
MKTKHTERLKEKRTKLKSGKIKKKLKMEQHSISKDKNKFTYGNSTIKSVDNMDIEDAGSIPNITNNSMECNSKQCTDRIVDDDWKLINSEKLGETEIDTDDWLQLGPKEKTNVGAPVVIDVISDGVTSLNLPETFEQTQSTRSSKNTFYTNDTFALNALSKESSACITVAKSIKPNQSTSQIRHRKQALSVSASTAKSIEPEQSRQIRHQKQPSHVSRSAEMSPNRSVNRSHVTKLRNSPQWENVDQANAQQHIATRKPQVYCIRNIVIVIMESKSRLCFTGKLLVKVLFGAVEIYGTMLDRSTGAREVYSPRGYSNVSIETGQTSAEDSIEAVWAALAPKGITRDSESKLQMDIDNVQPGTAVLVLQNFENGLTRFLNAYVPSFRLFPNVNNPCYYSWMDPKRAEIVLQANLHLGQHDDPNYRRLIADPCITVDIAEKMISDWRANKWSCTLIAGGKGVGKSTSVRYLVNSLLRTSGKVVLVDVDPGQAECTPAGCLSCSLIEEPLLGPNFTHLRTPAYQLFLDDVNVARCVTRYLEGVKMLVERLQNCPSLSCFPVVVNTMGFTANLGWDIAMFTIKLIRPTIILQIMSSRSKNYQDYLSAEVVNKQKCTWMCCDETFIDWDKPCEHELCIFRSHVRSHKDEWNMEPYQQRELVMISYLSGIVCNNDNDDSLQYNAQLPFNINKAVPYTAPFSSLCIIPQRLFGVPASHVLNVVNGNIVALCGVDLTEESSQESENTCGLRVLTQRSPLCTCYGFGIIRGIDTERQEVFINTPLPISIMQHINCLAGCIPIPSVLLQLNQGAPYVGENASLPTSREVRRGGFRMKYHRKPNNNPNKTTM